MDVIVLVRKNDNHSRFDINELDQYVYEDSYEIDDDQSISNYLDDRYDPIQTSHNYIPYMSEPPFHPIHSYSTIITSDDPGKILYIVTSQAYFFGEIKSSVRTQVINEIIK